MNSIVTDYSKEKQEIIFTTDNEKNYQFVQEICRLFIDKEDKIVEQLKIKLDELKEGK